MAEKINIAAMFSKFSIGQKRILFFLVLFCVIGQLFFLSSIRGLKKKSAINDARTYGESIAAGILTSLEESVGTTQLIKDIYLEYGSLFEKDFVRLCRRLYNDNVTIGSIYIAPDGIISAAYPMDVQKDTIGFNMLLDPEQSERAKLAIDSRKITVAGPHKLVEGGTGFIIRNPVFVGEQFKAFTIVVLDWNKFLTQILRHINHEKSGYHFGVWKENSRHILEDENGFMFTDAGVKVSRLVDIPIEVPNDVWHLSVEPVVGWHFSRAVIPEFIFSVLIIIGILVISIIRMSENANKLYQIEHDELTGYLTKPAFFRRMDQILKNNPGKSYDILLADIENFKLINSIHGMAKGDEVLQYLAFQYSVYQTSMLFGRFGGDSLICFFPSSENIGIEKFMEKSKKIIEHAPISSFKVNYGFYGNVDHALAPNIICDRALLAAKSIKQNYNRCIANYDGPVSMNQIRVQLLENSFEEALSNNEFKVWFQPKFDVKTEKLVGAEALVRWIRSDGTMISPADFISIFENDGLIVRLDEYIFKTVCNILKNWKNSGIPLIPISINLSRTSLHATGLVERYSKIVEEAGIPIEMVPLELTESATSSSIDIKQLISDLKAVGFSIHMDDFGTGFSSLENLNILPFDVIKLDKSLIDFIGDAGGDEILRHVIELAHFKKMHIVAEGVEDKDQLNFLRNLNCDYVQGYYYSAPKSYEKFVDYFTKLYTEKRV